MKTNRLKIGLIFTMFVFLIALIFAGLFTYSDMIKVRAEGETAFSSSTYKTAGASVRLFEKDGSALQDGETGIRFHVLMNADLYEENKDKANFKTYTVILPTYLLSGELTYTTENALVLETTDVWGVYQRDDSYFESVAYVYGLPVSQYATELAFRGVVSFDGGKTVTYQTETSTRSMAFVAKAARDDDSAVLSDVEKEKNRINTLNAYIPKYNLIYKVGNETTMETTEYGSTPAAVPQGVSIWKNEKGEKVNVAQEITLNNKGTTATQDIILTAYANIKISTINSSARVNGTSLANGSTMEVMCGTYTIEASPITNYYISSLSIDGSNKGAISSYSVSVMGDTDISIVASIITYSVTLDNVGGASVSGNVNGTYNINSTCSFTLGTGFYSVTVNGTEISPSTSRGYSFAVTANSIVKIVKLTDSETKAKIMNLIASTSGGKLSVSGDKLVSPSDTGQITIAQAVFDELKKYGYTTLSFDIYKPQKKEILYKKRIQNITDGITIAECAINKDSISGSVSLTKGTTLEGQYKSFGSWSGESIGVSWTLSNISFS